MSTQIEVIHVEIGKGSQDVIYTELLRVGPHMCEIRIRSDAFAFQCYATASVWSRTELRWNQVAHIHYSKMSTASGLAYASGTDPSSFQVDRQRLVDRLVAVLGADGSGRG